jgi:exopolyphosphatase/guanosine-5'-triphosphate,3'-diphosphate pyrophosphatase
VHAVGADVIAAIDIGTNSVHMVVARITGLGRFEILTREKDVVRLGSGGSDMKRLEQDAIDRGIETLERCRRIAENFEARIVAVATSAVREAENRDEFLRRARDEAGVEVEVISGFEEARLIHLGVLQSVAVYDREIVMCDIGGGSTELLIGKGEDVIAARSLKLGAIRLTQRFFGDDKLNHKSVERAVEKCRRHIEDMLLPFLRDTRAWSPEVVVGSSGTIETLAAMALARRGDDVPRSLNAATLSRKDLVAVIDDVVAAGDAEAIGRLPGSDPSRGDILLAGALILEAVMEGFGLDELIVSEYALREGVLLDATRRLTAAPTRHLGDIRRQGVLHLMELSVDDPDHAFQTAWLACRLFDLLGDDLGVPPEHEELLEAAALLANVGLWLSHSRHHQHSYYMIRNSEHLTGFTDGEIEIVAQVARYHRKSAPSVDRHPAYAALDEGDREVVRRLAALLRVAIGLDRSHAELVQRVEVRRDADSIVIEVGGDDEADLALELWSASQRTGLLQEVLGREVRVDQVPISTTVTFNRLPRTS